MAVKNTIDEVLDPAIRKSGGSKETLGRIVIGTVEGDVHSIGKDLVGSFLFSNGFVLENRKLFFCGCGWPLKIFAYLKTLSRNI